MISPLLYLVVLLHAIGIVSVLLDTFLFFFIELLVLYYSAGITIPCLTCKCLFFNETAIVYRHVCLFFYHTYFRSSDRFFVLFDRLI